MGSNSTTIPTTSVAELKYLSLLARDYPTQAAAASAVISLEATAKLPKGTEHYISDLHGEDEAFIHLLNSASGVIREKVDLVLGENVPKAIRAELATLIYYPARKLPLLKARYPERFELEAWYRQTLLRLIDVCRFVSSKHTREYVRSCLPQGCGHIIDELLHAHFEDHNKTLYYGQIVGSIIANDRADAFIIRLCELIKRLAVDKLHIIGDLFDRGPRPDLILDRLMTHHNVDFQWGNHDVVWMGAAAGSALCCCTVLKTTLAYHNHGMIEDFYGINLRHLLRMAEQYYGNEDLTIWMPHTDATRGPYTDGMLHRCAVMHKAITILMLKLECEVIDRNPDFKMQGRDFLRRIDYEAGTVDYFGKIYPLRDRNFPTVDPENPARLNADEKFVLDKLVAVIPLGVAGAAIATVASQVVSAVLTVRCIHGSQGMPWHLQLKNIRMERSVLLAICRIGLPGAAQSALYSISNMTIQSAINGFGTVAVAAWSVYGKIDFLFWMTVSSFGIAVTTFAGQNFGARQYDRVRRGTMTCLAMTAGTTLCISLALYPSAQLLFRLFSSDDAVVAQGVQMMHYLVPVYMTYICIEIFSGALRGCGDVRVPTIITVFAVCIMRIVWLAVALPFKHELSVVEFSYPLTWITATVLFAIYYAKGGWMQRCIAAQNAKTQG